MARKQRKHSAAFKTQVVLELLTGKASVSELARQHKLKDSLIYKWRSDFLAHAPQVFEAEPADDRLVEEIRQLKEIIGQQAIELEAAKKASRWLTSVAIQNVQS